MSDPKRIKLTTSNTIESTENVKEEDVITIKTEETEETESTLEQFQPSTSTSLLEMASKFPELTIEVKKRDEREKSPEQIPFSYISKRGRPVRTYSKYKSFEYEKESKTKKLPNVTKANTSKTTSSERPVLNIFSTIRNMKQELDEASEKLEATTSTSNKPKRLKKESEDTMTKKLPEQTTSNKVIITTRPKLTTESKQKSLQIKKEANTEDQITTSNVDGSKWAELLAYCNSLKTEANEGAETTKIPVQTPSTSSTVTEKKRPVIILAKSKTFKKEIEALPRATYFPEATTSTNVKKESAKIVSLPEIVSVKLKTANKQVEEGRKSLRLSEKKEIKEEGRSRSVSLSESSTEGKNVEKGVRRSKTAILLKPATLPKPKDDIIEIKEECEPPKHTAKSNKKDLKSARLPEASTSKQDSSKERSKLIPETKLKTIKKDQKTEHITFPQLKSNQNEAPKTYRKTVRLNITLPDPEEDRCPEFNYKQLLKEELKKCAGENKNSSNSSNQNDEVENDMEIDETVEADEQKTVDSRGEWDGYDENDSFIDNTIPCDELIPDDVTTELGGFYVNSGKLTYRKIQTITSESSTESDETDIIKRLPKPKRMGKKNMRGVVAKKIPRRVPSKKNLRLKYKKKAALKKEQRKNK